MEFYDVIRRRRMVRAFAPDPLDPDTVRALLDNARRAPSAGFSQGTEFVVWEGPDETAAFWAVSLPEEERDTFPWEGVIRAPLVVAIVPGKDIYLDRYAEADKGWTDRDETHWPAPFWDIDAGMAAMSMLLSAVDHGLGALFFGIPPVRLVAVMDAFDIPHSRRPIGFVAAGIPEPDRRSASLRRGRRPFDDVVHRGRW